MSFFNFFKRKKKKEKQKPKPEITISVDRDPYYDDEYFKLLVSSPHPPTYKNRSFDFPLYTDSFDTGTEYTLRELLLLVWWGRTKSGRKETVKIPKYFFKDYSLDGDMTTRSFIDNHLLEVSNGRITLTEKGQDLYNKFESLWEIHSIKNRSMNLDLDFPGWDKEKYDLEYYKSEIDYTNKDIAYSAKMIEYLKNSNIPDKGEQLTYHTSNRSRQAVKLKELEEKYSILKNRYKNK